MKRVIHVPGNASAAGLNFILKRHDFEETQRDPTDVNITQRAAMCATGITNTFPIVDDSDKK
jgi:hypothetical protein